MGIIPPYIIEIWDSKGPVALPNVHIVRSGQRRKGLPSDVVRRADENWKLFSEVHPHARDKDIANLVSYSRSGERVEATVISAPYRFSQYLNRDDKTMQDSWIANQLDYNPLATWILALCDNDRYALFGNKKDFGARKVSGFGGFIHDDKFTGHEVDLGYTVRHHLNQEAPDLSERMRDVVYTGLNYIPRTGTKGFNAVIVPKLDGKKEVLEKISQDTPQFRRQLIPVQNDSASLAGLLTSDRWEPTVSCIAGILSHITSAFGEDEMRRAISSWHMKDLVRVLNPPAVGRVAEHYENKTHYEL